MALPVDTKFCYLIEPFGTTGKRAFPHTGDDWARLKVGNVAVQEKPDIYAVRPGVVVAAGWHAQAGWRTVIAYDYGNPFGVYGHQAALLVKVGDRVATRQRIGLLGGTGKTSGPHLHYSEYLFLASALSGIVRHWVGPSGPLWKSVDAWAAASGLVRPNYDDNDRGKGSTGLPGEEDDVALTQKQAEALDWLGEPERRSELDKLIYKVNDLWNRRGVIDDIGNDVNALEWLAKREAQEDVEAYQLAQVFARIGIWDNLPTSAGADQIAAAVAAKLAIPGVTPEVVKQIAAATAVAVNDEAHRRSAS